MRRVLPAGALAILAAALTAAGGAAAPQPTGGPAAERSAEVWAVGDAYPNAGGRLLAARVRHAHPALLLYLGDVYETGSARDFTQRYDPLYGALAARTLPTIGNHEYANRATGYAPYWAAKRGRPMPLWSKRKIAGWEILTLSSEAPHGTASAQLRWLRRATRRAGDCRLAITHRPRYSSGYHGDQPDMQPLWAALDGHARLLLSGHDHDLQRLADHQGVRQIVSGAGGRPNRPFARSSALPLRFAERLRPGAVRLKLAPGRAQIDFVDASGRLLDRSHVRCSRLRG